MTSPLSPKDHKALSKRLDAIEADLVLIHAGLRPSHLVTSRTRLDASKALAAVRALRLSLTEQMAVETRDAARLAYYVGRE